MSTIESNSDGSGRKLAAKRGGDRRGEVPLSAENYPCLGRRRFLAGLAAMATPSLLGSRVVRAAAPAGSPGKTSPTAPAAQPSVAPLPSIQLGPYRISRLVAGANPLGGHSYQGPHTDQSMKEYFT